MSIYKTLKELEKNIDNSSSGDFASRPFLRPESGESFRIRFRQELAEDGKNYDPERGTAAYIGVHKHPLDFKKRAACTKDMAEYDYRCWACEQIGANNKWRPQLHVLVNVAVLNGDTWEQKIFDQGFSRQHVGKNMIEMAAEFGTITDRTYKLSRTGVKLTTQYTLFPLEIGDEPTELKDVDLFKFDGIYKVIPYNEQEEFFLATANASEEEPAGKGW